jgi:hypothetical protein
MPFRKFPSLQSPRQGYNMNYSRNNPNGPNVSNSVNNSNPNYQGTNNPVNVFSGMSTPQTNQPNTLQQIAQQQNGKSVLEIDIDALEDKGWRRPGADITDYFNYGFTEETWKGYYQKQIQMRLEQGMQGRIKVWTSEGGGPGSSSGDSRAILTSENTNGIPVYSSSSSNLPTELFPFIGGSGTPPHRPSSSSSANSNNINLGSAGNKNYRPIKDAKVLVGNSGSSRGEDWSRNLNTVDTYDSTSGSSTHRPSSSLGRDNRRSRDQDDSVIRVLAGNNSNSANMSEGVVLTGGNTDSDYSSYSSHYNNNYYPPSSSTPYYTDTHAATNYPEPPSSSARSSSSSSRTSRSATDHDEGSSSSSSSSRRRYDSPSTETRKDRRDSERTESSTSRERREDSSSREYRDGKRSSSRRESEEDRSKRKR